MFYFLFRNACTTTALFIDPRYNQNHYPLCLSRIAQQETGEGHRTVFGRIQDVEVANAEPEKKTKNHKLGVRQ